MLSIILESYKNHLFMYTVDYYRVKSDLNFTFKDQGDIYKSYLIDFTYVQT